MSDDKPQDMTEQKEQHRLGTINRWDPPEGDWAAEHDWTRYRGPDPWPVPGGWVFNDPEGGGHWRYFDDLGVGHHDDNSILNELIEDESVEEPYDVLDGARGERAFLSIVLSNPDEVSLRNPEGEEYEWSLEIGGTEVFSRIDPDRPDAIEAVAQALAAYHDGALEDRVGDIAPSSGRKPKDVREQEKVEQRQAENESLEQFQAISESDNE